MAEMVLGMSGEACNFCAEEKKEGNVKGFGHGLSECCHSSCRLTAMLLAFRCLKTGLPYPCVASSALEEFVCCPY